MTDNKGNQYREDNYEGYGVFGGKDYYILLAEMNGCDLSNLTEQQQRGIGIYLEYAFYERENNPKNGQPIIFPSLSECGRYYSGGKPENCPYQGYFYNGEDDDLDDDDYHADIYDEEDEE
jgi:hypothetical protein